MPTSAQSAVSASPRLSVDGSEGDREPARDNVIPRDMYDHRRASARTGCLNRNARRVHGDEWAFDHGLGFTRAIADVDALAVEALVFLMAAERSLGARRRDLEVVSPVNQVGVVEQRARNTADALAVLDGDGLDVVDRDAESPPRVARLVKRVK